MHYRIPGQLQCIIQLYVIIFQGCMYPFNLLDNDSLIMNGDVREPATILRRFSNGQNTALNGLQSLAEPFLSPRAAYQRSIWTPFIALFVQDPHGEATIAS